jgi:glutaconate CoA-transferase subunit A
VSCEQIVTTADLVAAAPPQALLLNRMMVDAVVETPNGAHFTSCVPDYGRDEAFQRAYAAAAADLEAWPAFAAEHGFAPFSAPRGADLGSSKVQSGGGGGR